MQSLKRSMFKRSPRVVAKNKDLHEGRLVFFGGLTKSNIIKTSLSLSEQYKSVVFNVNPRVIRLLSSKWSFASIFFFLYIYFNLKYIQKNVGFTYFIISQYQNILHIIEKRVTKRKNSIPFFSCFLNFVYYEIISLNV